MFPFDDVIMISTYQSIAYIYLADSQSETILDSNHLLKTISISKVDKNLQICIDTLIQKESL